MDQVTQNKINVMLEENSVMIFIKGEPSGPMCGYSSRVVEILDSHTKDYGFFNVLEDQEIWAGIKEHGNWPTIPQVYVKGKLIGGCDIIVELENSGELQEILKA